MRRVRGGLTAFDTRAREAARTLLHNQGYDGGWGLTLTSVSSIVNTSEVLSILRAAGTAGQPVRHALDFLTGAIAEHCRPRNKGAVGGCSSPMVDLPGYVGGEVRPGLALPCDPAAAAHGLRQKWDLGDGPITHLVRRLIPPENSRCSWARRLTSPPARRA